MERCGHLRLISDTNPYTPVPYLIIDVYKKDNMTMQVEHEWFEGHVFFNTNKKIDLVRSPHGRLWLYISSPYQISGDQIMNQYGLL